MTRTRRRLAGAAALLTVSVVASGCGSSPFAASVNGQVIRQTALNAELRQFAANPSYVQLVQAGDIAKAVTVAGTSSGSYSSTWTAGILTTLVVDAVVHQHLRATGHQPGPGQYAATRAVDSVLYGPQAWDRFSPAFRTTIVDQDADLAMVEPNLVTPTELTSVFTSFPTQLFAEVCVRTVALGVTGANGAVDFPASLARAKAVVSAVDAASRPRGGVRSSAVGGSVACYRAAQLETQSLAFVERILSLRTGTAAAPQKTAGGYQVTAVTSRTLVPADNAVGAAVTVASNQSRGVTAQVLGGLLAGAHVKVNPLYGTWTGSAKVPYSVVPGGPVVGATSS